MFNNVPLSMSTEVATKGITFSKILSGASKTLNFINQAIPVYYQTKPLFNNAKTLIKAFKKVNNSENSSITNTTTITPHEQQINNNDHDDEVLYTSLTMFQ